MKRLPLLLAVFCCAFALQAADKPDEVAVAVALEPGKIHEECLRIGKGDKRRYHWKSNAPVDFNIHYHRGPEVFYPVKRDGMRGDGGTFDPRSDEDYCWMWSARTQSAKIEGRIEKK